MTTTCHVSISLDGYLAGPDQSFETPLGVGGESLHEWHFPSSGEILEEDRVPQAHLSKPRGAYVMGRKMFGPPVSGEWTSWDPDWRGWWGDEPPYHAPVFVLTHHEHDPIEMAGGTTFRFVTDGFDAAFAQAAEAAGDQDVLIAGGAATIRQALAARVLDEIYLDIAPVLLGGGERLLEGVEGARLTPVEVVHSPRATHVRYLVG